MVSCFCPRKRALRLRIDVSPRAAALRREFLTRVDVTDDFPFLVTKLSPYYDR